MCEFCTKHGEGEIWYRNVKNYAGELLHDPRRQAFIQHFFENTIQKGHKSLTHLEAIKQKLGCIPGKIKKSFTESLKPRHFGQVVTLEDSLDILNKANSIVRLPCACCWEAEKKERRTCLAFSYSAQAWYKNLNINYFETDSSSETPHLPALESITLQKARECIRQSDKEGLVHSIWTMETPFIGTLCNCEKKYCLSMRATVGLGMETMFPGEYSAHINSFECNSCGACAGSCSFNAISEGNNSESYQVDTAKCYGCGLCRSECPTGAISMCQRHI